MNFSIHFLLDPVNRIRFRVPVPVPAGTGSKKILDPVPAGSKICGSGASLIIILQIKQIKQIEIKQTNHCKHCSSGSKRQLLTGH